ncbi:hypothetical protein [Acinetobacter brisouii]|nr:hypothetical protein [Acinetobacter brisouii]
MSSLKVKDDSELENPLKERIKFLMTESELNHPYSFATRVGLSKGTFTGIWKEGRSSLHHGTVNKICAATGANPAWLVTGMGEPFEQQASAVVDVLEPKQDVTLEAELLDTSLLEQAFETLDQALKATNRMMQPNGRAQFVAAVYASLKEDQAVNIQVLKDCIFTVEEALSSTRRIMSPKAKTDLILLVYELYSGEASYKEAMTSTINQLIRSVS